MAQIVCFVCRVNISLKMEHMSWIVFQDLFSIPVDTENSFERLPKKSTSGRSGKFNPTKNPLPTHYRSTKYIIGEFIWEGGFVSSKIHEKSWLILDFQFFKNYYQGVSFSVSHQVSGKVKSLQLPPWKRFFSRDFRGQVLRIYHRDMHGLIAPK